MEHGIFGWLVIMIGLVFIFGGSKRLSDLGKGFGSFMREFNKAKNEGDDEAAKLLKEKETQAKLTLDSKEEPKN
jgi:Sec-independent protein translocase protein TatA